LFHPWAPSVKKPRLFGAFLYLIKTQKSNALYIGGRWARIIDTRS
jgi:hypothetical protein